MRDAERELRRFKGDVEIGRLKPAFLGQVKWACRLHIDGEVMIIGHGGTIDTAITAALRGRGKP